MQVYKIRPPVTYFSILRKSELAYLNFRINCILETPLYIKVVTTANII
jgi:hypothetical protein